MIPAAFFSSLKPSISVPESGQMLAAGFNNGQTYSLLVWNTSDWSIAHSENGAQPSVQAVGFNNDVSLLAVGKDSAITIFNTLDWSTTQTLSTTGFGGVLGLEFSPDGSYLAVAIGSSPFIKIYNTSTWTAISNPGTLPTGSGTEVSWSTDGSYLAVSHFTTPFITVYNTSTWTKLTNPVSLPLSNSNFCRFSKGNSTRYLAVGHGGGTSAISTFTVSGSTITKLTQISPNFTDTGFAGEFSAADESAYWGTISDNKVHCYAPGDPFTEQLSPTLVNSTIQSISADGLNTYLAVGGDFTGRLRIYSIGPATYNLTNATSSTIGTLTDSTVNECNTVRFSNPI